MEETILLVRTTPMDARGQDTKETIRGIVLRAGVLQYPVEAIGWGGHERMPGG